MRFHGSLSHISFSDLTNPLFWAIMIVLFGIWLIIKAIFKKT